LFQAQDLTMSFTASPTEILPSEINTEDDDLVKLTLALAILIFNDTNQVTYCGFCFQLFGIV